MSKKRPTWREHYEAAKRINAARRKVRQLAGLRRIAEERRRARAALLDTLRRESYLCARLHAYADEATAPTLSALGQLAAHYAADRVRFEGVTFRVTYSAWRGAVRDPDTGEPLVLFSCSP